ncbi:hypothetical protein [Youxingia wuxianensis]|uniref:Uncharacterized protein n=1 Tax=Youxingia wuxianensis TaxID=2763678 RepID=A0A926ERA7_9FIRM|nr:hypothetical protein [Youxingia wuxianensis]MBC8585202.1 hypothetical protein [Youxingia wuxianensis]
MFIIQKNDASSKTIRMPNALIEQLEEIAASEDISFNQLVVQCCEYALANLPKNDGKITCTEQFISRKRQIKSAFETYYLAEHPAANKTTVMQVFADAIYPTQRRHAALGIDLYSVLSGKISIDEYRSTLESYFLKINRNNPESQARNYANCTKQLKAFMEQADLI